MISHDKEFIFIHIPKTSGNSLSVYLKPHVINGSKIIRRNSKMGKSQGIDIICEKYRCDIKHKSIIYYKKIYPSEYNKYFKFTIVRNPYDRLISLYFWTRPNGEFTKENFSVFLKKNIKSQVSFIMDNGSICMDFICKFENIEDDIKKVMNILSIQYTDKYPHINSSRHKHYMDYYDDDLINIVNNKFSDDFNMLGYDKVITYDELL